MGIGIKRAVEKGSIRSAYTLAEVVIVMLVVAVVVGVSIKITKAKLDNIISYTYYSGYSTLRNVTGQMRADFSIDDDKKYLELPSGALSFFNRFIAQKAMAKSCMYQSDWYKSGPFMFDSKKVGIKCHNYTLESACAEKTWVCSKHIGQYGITKEMCDANSSQPYLLWLGKGNYDAGLDNNFMVKIYPEVKDKKFDYLGSVVCGSNWANGYWDNDPAGLLMGCGGYARKGSRGGACDMDLDYYLIPTIEYIPDDPEPEPAPPECTTPSDAEKQAQYCQGKEFDQTTCSWKDISPWPPCDREGMRWSQNSCACVQEPPTVPRKGQNFCEKFVSYANTKSNSAECSGDAIPNNLTDFSDKAADITLRNGMRIYNIRQNPAEIPVLANNIQGASYDGVPNVNTYGYTIYLDIDGEKGPSTLWKDVYPFYITMSGTVIPAYNMTVNSEETGGNSRHHLMTSIQKESIDATGHRKLYWVSKSVSYKDGACSAGYIGASTAYCHGVPLKASCSGEDGICILKYVSPVKFFQ